MRCNHSNVNLITEKNNAINKNENIKFNTLREYTTLYLTYQLLYCQGCIQIISNHSNVNIEKEKIE